MVCGTAALMITAGGACGYNCRRDRALDDRDEMLNHVDEVLAKNIKDCDGDAACIQTERNRANSERWRINQWYQNRQDENYEESRESRQFVKDLLEELGKKAIEKVSTIGSVSGQGQIVETASVIIASNTVGTGGDESGTGSGGVGTTSISVNTITTSVVDTVTNSTTGLVEAQLIRYLQGSFTVNILDDSMVESGQYTFNFNFVIGKQRQINGLSVREISSGSAPIAGTGLVLVLNGDAGRSSLVIGQNGIGILRLNGEILSDDIQLGLPSSKLFKMDLPVTQNADGSISIETNGDVDLNILVNDEDPWYVDYDLDGAITPNDRLLFSIDHAAGELWTDLVGDEIIDGADMLRFDDETGLAVARQNYLVGQGIIE